MNYYLEAFREWNNFSGRATRKEYWMYVLFNTFIAIGISFIGMLMDAKIFTSIYNLIIFIPGIAITTRRLHDSGRSGWWQLLLLIPVIGWIWMIILLVMESK
ncbi:MAG: DUF805 domain-containing protein [Psychrilyobacter sp.]|nr:DUF805 domain-containing protein [Psychrilyobacter sp.]